MTKRLKAQSEEAGHLPTNSIVLASDNIKLEARNLLIDCLNQIHKAPSSNADVQPAKSGMDDSRDKDHGLPFQYGRNPADVEDPMQIDDRRSINELCSKIFKHHAKDDLVTVYFAKQKVFTCTYCNSTFRSSKFYDLITHLLSKYHFSKVAEAGLVFSRSRDLQKLEELSKKAFKEYFNARIPFVSVCHNPKSKMCFETIFNKLACLNRCRLMDDGFSQFMFLKYPNIKHINSCAICETPVSCEQNADDYLKHFLSPSHIAKATENKWKLGDDYGKIAGSLSNYLHNSGRKKEAKNMTKSWKIAATNKTYSKDYEEYKHLFEMDIIDQEW